MKYLLKKVLVKKNPFNVFLGFLGCKNIGFIDLPGGPVY